MKHILILGDRGAGKSTLIRRLSELTALPRFGFFTKRGEPDSTGFHPIYIWPAWDSSNRSLVGSCNSKKNNALNEVFNTVGAEAIDCARGKRGFIIMDELGFMEAGAKKFTASVFNALAGDVPVIAAVKNRPDVPFLKSVLEHPNAQVFRLDEGLRETLFLQLAPIVSSWGR